MQEKQCTRTAKNVKPLDGKGYDYLVFFARIRGQVATSGAEKSCYTTPMITWQIKKLSPTAIIPTKKNPTDAGWDIYSNESVTLQPNARYVFSTGFSAAFSPDFVAVIKDRSSLGSKGIHTLAGVIDATYRGEWKIVIRNTSDATYEVTAGDRIAQCIFLPVPEVVIEVVEDLSETVRGAGGFGSTGK